MTERELFIESIPQIAEIAVECKKMSPERYAEIKEELLQSVPEVARSFMKKVFLVVDKQLFEN